MADWEAGLKDQDELSQFPSAVRPLDALGIDPDEARAKPELLNGLGPLRSAENKPAESDTKPSARAAGALGGAGAPDFSGFTPTSEPEPSDPEGYGMEGLGLLRKNLRGATRAVEDISTAPPSDIARLTSQREKLAMPAARYDPTTGKPLAQTQEYDPDTGKMVTVNPEASRGEKVWRGVRGGLVGLMTGGVPGAAVGAMEPQDIPGGKAYGAPSKAYQRAEQRRQQGLDATNQGLDTAFKTWKDTVDAQKAKSGEYRANANLGKDITAGATGLINAENKPESEDRKTQAKLDLTEKEFNQRITQADRLGLKGVQRTLYIANNGKLPDPRQATEGELALAQATKAFIAENGRPPKTLEEFNKIAQASRGNVGKAEGDAEKTDAANLRAAMGVAERHLKALQDLSKHTYGTAAKAALDEKIKDAQGEYDDLQGQLTTRKAPASNAAPAVAPASAPVAPTAPQLPNAAAVPPPMAATGLPDGTMAQGQKGEQWIVKGGKWQQQK